MQEITVATSIAPRGIEKQARAVESWLQRGFDVISVNAQDEISLLSGLFPKVRFIPAHRTALEKIGKKLVYVNDVCSALQACNTRFCGIINSDIVFADAPDLIPFLHRHGTGSFIFGHRLDVENLDSSEGYPYIRGFDYFFFDRTFIKSIPAADFFLGATWWDLWLPLVAEHSGLQLIQPMERFALHQNHPIAWSLPDHLAMGRNLFEFLIANRYPVHNHPIFNPVFENFQKNYDGLCFVLLLDYIMEHSIKLSICDQTSTIVKVSPIIKPSEPDISLVFREISHANLHLILDFIDYMEQQDINDKLEMLFVVEYWFENNDVFNTLMEKAYKYGNINCIRFFNQTSKHDVIGTVKKLTRGRSVLVLDQSVSTTSGGNINQLQFVPLQAQDF